MAPAVSYDGGRGGSHDRGADRIKPLGYGWEVQPDGVLVLYFYEDDPSTVGTTEQPAFRDVLTLHMGPDAIANLAQACAAAAAEREIFCEATAAIRERRRLEGGAA